MAENKKSFIAYCDWKETFDTLPDEKAGQLIKHLLAYVNDCSPCSDDVLINAVFANIKQTLKRDLKKYESIKIKRSLAGKASAVSRASKLTKSTHVKSVEQTLTNSTDSVNDSVNVIKNIYNDFYYFELENSKNKKEEKSYSLFVAFLFGNNDLNEKISSWLNLKNQMTYDQYEKLVIKARTKNRKISDMIMSGHNDAKKYLKGKTSMYLTLNNWLNISK